jgi:fructokinase
MAERLLVIGEMLIDIARTPDGAVAEHVGGSPANVAMGLARLGHAVDFATVLGRDDRGARCARLLDEVGVRLVAGGQHDEPTSTADATIDENGGASYVFDLHWDLPMIALPEGTVHVHTGSIATTLTPGEVEVTAALVRARPGATTSYDPNIRPTIMGTPDEVRPRVEELIGHTDVVKASDEDIAYLYADEPVDQVMRRWASMGPGLVVVTRGPHGVSYRVSGTGETGHEPAVAERVIDTVGAGDSFMAGLISGLVDLGLLGGGHCRERLASATLAEIAPAVARALASSGVTVGHAGAYAPTRTEIGA